jgi:hypothetical protein
MTAMRSTLPSAHTTSKGWWQRSWQAATGRASEGWVKVKNPNYWRRDSEREAMQRSRERRQRTPV